MLLPFFMLLLWAAVSCDNNRLVVRVGTSEDCARLLSDMQNDLTMTSQLLHNLTDGRMQWDRVTIFAPGCSEKTRRIDSSADIVVHPHSFPSDYPWAKQFGGCRVSGSGVHLGRPFFNGDSFDAHLLLQQWIKHRFGVFSQRGFQDDPQFPYWTSQFGSHPPDGQPLQLNNCRQEENATEFDCDDSTPTKQNVQCDGQSVQQIIEENFNSESSTFFPPEFEIFSPITQKRYVLVVDRSNRHWTVVRRALYRWIHSLSDGVELSVVDGQPNIVLGWTKVSGDNRDGLAGRIPRRPSESSSIVAAIRLGRQMLDDGADGELVLLTGSSVSYDQSDVIIHTIAFPSQSAAVDVTGGHGLQLAVEEGDAMQSRLVAALLQILGDDAPIQVYQETERERQSGSFVLDSPMGTNVRLVVHCEDEGDIDTVQVVSPSGKIYDLPLIADGMLHIRIAHTDEFGEWNYRMSFAQPVTTTVQVTAQPHRVDEAIIVRAWTNVGRRPVNASDTPVLLYAEVTSGLVPVIDAQVIALVQPPDNSTRPFVIQLHDRGTGDPDITRADGIYSAYFTRAVSQAGHYAVTIQVTDNSRRASIPVRDDKRIVVDCCGSSLPYDKTTPIQPFRRVISGPSFVTSDGPHEDQDVYPPARIADLRVERIVNVTNQVELGWTAPGTDYDAGSAAFYQIRCYTDRTALNDSGSAILVHSSLTPQPLPAGTWQKALVAVPWPNQIFYYAIVAVDYAGLRGKVSNIVPVYIEEPPPPPTTTTTQSALPEPTEEAVRALTDQQLYAIAGGVAGFVLLLVVLSVAACLKRKEDKKPQGKPMVKIQVEPTEKKEEPVDETRPVYKIYVNNAYIQEEDGELKIVTPDGRVIQRGSPWFSSSTLPRGGRSLTNLQGIGTSAQDLHHWSLPRAKTSPHRHKVLTNGSIMPSSSQSVIPAVADGTSISSKPSVSSDDTGIEVSDHQTDSRDSGDMILPPPGFGPAQQQSNGYLPMYASNLLPPLPPSPGMSQDARVVRIPSFLNDESWLGEPSSRRPIMIGGSSYGSEDRTPQISPPPPSTPTLSQSSNVQQPRRKTRHISFV